jgi:uncharacterized integral membrane protein (TIGR00698 family)
MTGALAIVPGLALASGMAACAFLLQHFPLLVGVSPAILAVVLGLAMRSVLVPSQACAPGLHLTKTFLLRCAVALLGLRVTFDDILGLGGGPVLAILASLAATFAVTLWVGRLMGVEPGLARLLAVGTSVCGASAIGAARALTRGDSKDDDAPYAVIVITILGTACLILFPLLASFIGLSDRLYGLWVGTSLHEVAQAVAAGAQRGADTAIIATLAKMERVLLLAPLLLVLAAMLRRQGNDGATAVRWMPPWFLFAFLGGAAAQSMGWVPAALSGLALDASVVLMAMALAAMGIATDLRCFLRRGFAPILLTVFASLFLGLVSLGLLAVLD